MSLRFRLTLGLIFVAAIGVVTVDIVNYTSLRTFLLDRADQTLDDAHYAVSTALQENTVQGGPSEAIKDYLASEIPSLVGSIQGNCIQIRTPENKVVGRTACLAEFQQRPLPPNPVFPKNISVPDLNDAGDRVRYFTVRACEPADEPVPRKPDVESCPPSSAAGGGNYRVRASVEQSLGDFIVLIATPLVGVDSTLHRLLVIELVVSGLVLVALAILGLWIVRLGLRPLEAIGQTATAIAGGDLSRRVEQVDEKTEIGRLGRLLNMMLGQIEAAFQAREASERKLRRFVADASHELRTPVAAVRAYAELFSRGAADRPADLERTMLGVTQASERMSVLVDELFLLAHLDEGRALAQEDVDLESVVVDAVDVAKALEPDRPLTYETRPVVVGDRGRLRQLVDNLLTNVRAHTSPETPAKVILDRSGGNAVIQVTDYGPGIDEESLPHVFERFYRAEAAQAGPAGGSGLGLAIVAALAEAHGGTAAVRSQLGVGTTFTITIPLAPADHGDGAGNEEEGRHASAEPVVAEP